MPPAHRIRAGGAVLRGVLSRLMPFFLPVLLFLSAADARAAAAVSERITLCLETLIPSLFGCTAAAALLRRSGAAAHIGYRLRRIGRLFRLNAAQTGIFALSQIAGYPVGALLLKQESDAGRVDAAEAASLSAVCYGGGPAFLVGFAGAELFGSAAAGWVMLAACLLANCAVLLLRRGNKPPVSSSGPPACRLSPAVLTASVTDAVRSLTQICGTVLCFGLLTRLPAYLGLLRLLRAVCAATGLRAQTVSALFAALLDVTQLRGLLCCGLPYYILLPLTAGLLSFGGISVQMQCLALGVPELSARRLCLTRLLTALLTAALTAAALPLIPVPDTAAVFAHGTAVSRSGSVLPGVLILCTGFPLLLCAPEQHDAPS